MKFETGQEFENLSREILDNKGKNLDFTKDKGLAFEVDLHFPRETHDFLQEYPILPVKRVVDPDELSPFTKELGKTHGFQGKSVPMLITDLTPRKNYKLLGPNLVQAISFGAVVTKIHRIVSYTQSPFLKNFIDYNTQRRSEATSLFEKNYYKLKNNSTYGKTLQNCRKYLQIEVVRNEEIFRKRTAKVGRKEMIIDLQICKFHVRSTSTRLRYFLPEWF